VKSITYVTFVTNSATYIQYKFLAKYCFNVEMLLTAGGNYKVIHGLLRNQRFHENKCKICE
jgi:hypothetical protein